MLFAGEGEPGTLNHIGVEVESTDEVERGHARAWPRARPAVQEQRVLLLRRSGQGVGHGPDNAWEFYTVLADAETIGCDISSADRLRGRDVDASETTRRCCG